MASVLLTLTKKGGSTNTDTLTFESTLMRGLAIVGTGIEFDYPERDGSYLRYATGALTTTQLQAAIRNSGAPGTVTYVGIIDATGGKAIGTFDVLDGFGQPITIPNKSVVWDGYYRVLTTFTSATDAATIALGYNTDGVAAIKAAIAISNGANPYDAAAPAQVIPLGTTATVTTKTTGDRRLQYTVAVEALTAGKLVIFVEVVTEPA